MSLGRLAAVTTERPQERNNRKLHVLVSESLYARLQQFARPEQTVSWVARWLLEAGIDRAEDEGMADMLCAHSIRRGEMDPDPAGLLRFMDEQRRKRMRGRLTPVPPKVLDSPERRRADER